jgi:hypothetical protein
VNADQPADQTPRIYPPRDLARLAYAQACRQLSDGARSQVSTTADRYAHPGEHVEAARQLVWEAEDALTRAVVYERQAGRSWADIGQALGVSAQTTQERFVAADRDWQDALVHPLRPERQGGGQLLSSALPDGADAPEDYTRWLDAWCERHTEPSDGAAYKSAAERAQQVSAGLTAHRDPYLAVTGEISLVLAQACKLTERPAHEHHPGELRAFHQRKTRLLAAIAALGEDPDAAELAAAARQQLAAMPDLEQPTNVVPLDTRSPSTPGTPRAGRPTRQEADRER